MLTFTTKIEHICGTGNSSQQTSLQCVCHFYNQHDIQRRGQDFYKNKNTLSIHNYMRIEELKLMHLKCNLFGFSSISAEYMQKI